jgi:hypothetical protein
LPDAAARRKIKREPNCPSLGIVTSPAIGRYRVDSQEVNKNFKRYVASALST